MMADDTQVMLFQDGDGAFYAVPLSFVQAFKVPDALSDSLAEALGEGGDVQGYGLPNAPFSSGSVFEVSDYSFDIEQVLNIGSQSSGAGAGKVTFNPFQITRKVDISSAVFYQSA